MLASGGLWLLLAVCVGAYEHYDDARNMEYNEDIIYPDETSNTNSDIDFGQYLEKVPLEDLILFKLMISIQNRKSDEQTPRYRPNLGINVGEYENSWPWPHTSNEFDFKGAVVKKRLPETKAAVKDIKHNPMIRRLPKWRLKRPPRLCLLKVCSPIYYAY